MTWLKPRSGSYDEALEAFRSGAFSSCLDLLSESVSVESSILRARALIRLGDASAAVDLLSVLDLGDASHELAAEALALQCYAFYVLKRSGDASALAVEARARCFSAGLVAIEGELLFASALASVRDGDLEAAESAAASILQLVDDKPSWVAARTYSYSLNFWRARACDALGLIENLRANYAAQASWHRRAFDEFDNSGVRDDYSLVLLLANYADTAVTLGSKEAIDFIVQRSNAISWNNNLVAHEYRLFSLLAEAASAIGDQIGALRYFRRCLDCAPSTALQIRAGVERGRLLHEIGESFSAREEIDHAVRLSRSFNWEAATAIDHRQLLMLASQVAKFDGPQAMAMLSRYDALEANSNLGIYAKDDRFRGEEFMARAAVFAANGNIDRAIMLLIDALATFTSAKLQNKAATAAAELAILTKESAYVEIVREHCAKYPFSILAKKLEKFDGLSVANEPSAPSSVRPGAVLFPRPKLELLS